MPIFSTHSLFIDKLCTTVVYFSFSFQLMTYNNVNQDLLIGKKIFKPELNLQILILSKLLPPILHEVFLFISQYNVSLLNTFKNNKCVIFFTGIYLHFIYMSGCLGWRELPNYSQNTDA